jgi:hypothetical protein
MDTATTNLLGQNIAGWCSRNADRLAAMEKGRWEPGAGARLFAEIESLGVLHILHDTELHEGMAMVAETAFGFALHSPSLALLIVQQNMAALLLAHTGAPAPTGWVTLPLYDSPAEWPFQLQAEADSQGPALNGIWRSLPALPIASRVLLPIDTGAAPFSILQIDAQALPRRIVCEEGILSLGLRGCPLGDLIFNAAPMAEHAVLASGPEMKSVMSALWSQAEVFMLAIRAAMLERSYTVARDYAAARWQGGKFIIEHSLVRKMLADLHLASSALGESWRSMAATVTPGKPLTAGQMAIVLQSAADLPKLTSDGIQLLGGNGYMEDYGQERLFRDAKQCEQLLGHPQAKRFSLWEHA